MGDAVGDSISKVTEESLRPAAAPRAPARITARIAGRSLVGALLVATAACGLTDDTAVPTSSGVPGTVAIGDMPQPLSDRPTVPTSSTDPTTTVVATTEPAREPIVGPVGDAVLGNRLLLIGDGVLASTAPRFGGIACDVLVGFGWAVEVAAEPGRFVDFGGDVLDGRLRPGTDWDAAVVMLGNQYDGDIARFERELTGMIERLAPRPVVVFTLSDVAGDRTEINDLIRDLPRFTPHVVVVDWAEITAAEPDQLLDDGGPALTEEGSGRLVLFMAAALGEAPGDLGGECLEPVFVDDSAIVL